jgi:hypothetical protein
MTTQNTNNTSNTSTATKTATTVHGLKFNHKQATALIEKIGQQQGAIAKDIRVICEDLILRFKLAGDGMNEKTAGMGDTTLVNELLYTLEQKRGAYERVGVWFIKNTGGALRFNKDDKTKLEKIKGRAFVVGDIDELPHPLDKIEKSEPTQEALNKKEQARLNYDKRALNLMDKLIELAKEYQNDLSLVIANPDTDKRPKLDDSMLAKLEAVTGVKLQTLESVIKTNK